MAEDGVSQDSLYNIDKIILTVKILMVDQLLGSRRKKK